MSRSFRSIFRIRTRSNRNERKDETKPLLRDGGEEDPFAIKEGNYRRRLFHGEVASGGQVDVVQRAVWHLTSKKDPEAVRKGRNRRRKSIHRGLREERVRRSLLRGK